MSFTTTITTTTTTTTTTTNNNNNNNNTNSYEVFILISLFKKHDNGSVHVNNSTVRVALKRTTRQSIRFVQLIISAIILLYMLRSAVSTSMLPEPSTPLQEYFRLLQALILLFLKEGSWKVCR
jgi:hypothetical protein